MRRSLLCHGLIAMLVSLVASACVESVRAPLRVHFPGDGSIACSTGLELWIRTGNCDMSSTEIYRAGFDMGARPTALETLPPGRYGFGARAHDASGNWFAEGCSVVTLPKDDGTPIDITLVRTGARLVCTSADGGGIDASVGMDAGRDAGTGTDAGAVDAGTAAPDAGVDAGGDPCESDEASAASRVGCNGPIRGPAPDDEFGGHCFVDADPAGSCNDGSAHCAPVLSPSEGMCVLPCPAASTYVSTGGCPSGSRCLRIDGKGSFCFPDCRSPSDCALDMCATDGAC